MSSTTPDDLYQMRREGKQIIWNLLDVELPIVAAINGPAIGLGATLALLCDAIFVAESAKIADPHVQVGIVAGDGGAVVWPMAMGPVRAKRYLLTGDALTAAEAERMGLVNAAVPDDELELRSMAFAQRLAAGAPPAIRYAKLAINQLVKQGMATAFDYSTALELVTFASSDHKEALRAIAAKDAPEFKGKRSLWSAAGGWLPSSARDEQLVGCPHVLTMSYLRHYRKRYDSSGRRNATHC